MYADAPRPRAEIVALIGEANQSVPVLVCAPDTAIADRAIPFSLHGPVRFINDPALILRYMSSQFGVAKAA